VTLTRRGLLAGPAALAVASTGMAHAQMNGFNTALDDAFSESGAPALAGMVLGMEGPHWMGARGVRRFGGADAATIHDRWHLGSNTKAMTAALYGRLVDRGDADWGSTMPALLPELAMDAAWQDVTINALVAHEAGLSDETAMGEVWLGTARGDSRSLPAQRQALAQAFLSVPPAGTPGIFNYANGSYVLIGTVIEKITGQAWEDVIRAELFRPLGITTGGYGAPKDAQPWGHVQGSAIDPDGPGSDNPLALGPAGTVHMSLEDYGRFLGVFLNDTSGWLAPRTRARLMQPFGSGSSGYAGGWIITPDQPWAKGSALTHDGSNTLWYASAWVAPVIGRAFVAVSNDAARGGPACENLITALIRVSSV